MLAIMDSCFGPSRPHQHDIASKQAQVPKTNISNGKSSMFVGSGYKNQSQVKYR